MTISKTKTNFSLRKLACAAVVVIGLTAGFSQQAHADWHHDRGGPPHGGPAHFHGYDDRAWHGGHWYRGYHDGRRGAWWIVGGQYYYYPQVEGAYPPNPYGPPVAYAPPPVVAAPPPPSPGINLVLPIHLH